MTETEEVIAVFFSLTKENEDLKFNSDLIGREMTIKVIRERIIEDNFNNLKIENDETGNKLFDWKYTIELIFNTAGFILDVFNVFELLKKDSKDKKVEIEYFKEEIQKINTESTFNTEAVFNYIIRNREDDLK